MSRVVEVVVPARLGRPFRWLLGSSWTSNLGDGIALAAGPLLVASQTSNPTLVAAAALLQRLPWLLLGLYAGVVADRVDRRRLVMVSDGLRVLVLLLLVASLVTGVVNVAVVLVAMFLLGVAEVFTDTATSALMPMIVEKRDLGVGNARLMGGFLVLNQLVGAPVGATLFAVGRAWPFAAQAVCVALGVVLVSRVALPPHGTAGESRHLVDEVREGWRWVWQHKPVRTLALTIAVFNVTWGCAWSVLVLYSRQRLGLDAIGFGLITSVIAAGGIVGTLSYDRLERRVPLAAIMRGVLAVETVVHLVLAATTAVPVALVAFFAFGMEAFVWGTTASSVRQRAVPLEVQGRVLSVYMIGLQGGLVIGALIAGPLASLAGITAPFWFAFAGSAAFLAVVWRQLGHVAHADEAVVEREPGSPSVG